VCLLSLKKESKALIHVSQLGLERGESLKDKFQAGSPIEAEVLSVDQS
jgi:ribosomal protein S1